MRVDDERYRRSVAISAWPRRRSRWPDGAVSLTVESIKVLFREYGRYKDKLYRDNNETNLFRLRKTNSGVGAD